jgi:hypothetical protein
LAVIQAQSINVRRMSISKPLRTYQYLYEPTTVDDFSVSDNKEVKPALIRIGEWGFKPHSQLVDARLALGQKK